MLVVDKLYQDFRLNPGLTRGFKQSIPAVKIFHLSIGAPSIIRLASSSKWRFYLQTENGYCHRKNSRQSDILEIHLCNQEFISRDIMKFLTHPLISMKKKELFSNYSVCHSQNRFLRRIRYELIDHPYLLAINPKDLVESCYWSITI